jgi:hypothetical protein
MSASKDLLFEQMEADDIEAFREAVGHPREDHPDEGYEVGDLVALYGIRDVWNDNTVHAMFDVTEFVGDYVHVKRRADGSTGTLVYQDHPRYYFQYVADNTPTWSGLDWQDQLAYEHALNKDD